MKIEDNMKMYFERKIENVHIETDVEEAVKNKLSLPVKRKYNTKIVALLAVLLITGITHTAVVYGQYIYEIIERITPNNKVEFANEEGESTWSAYLDPELKGREPFEDKVDRIWEAMEKKEGKSYLICVRDENGKERMVIRSHGKEVKTIEEINEYALNYSQVSMPDSLLGTLKFHEGSIHYNSVQSYEEQIDAKEEMNKESVEYIVKELESEGPPSFFSYTYYNEDKSEEVMISILVLNETSEPTTYLVETSSDGKKYVHEKILVNGLEVLYGEIGTNKSVSWHTDAKSSISIWNILRYTKDDALNIAKEIIEYNK